MNTPAWITLIVLCSVSIAVIAGWVMRNEPHTAEDDAEQLHNIQPDFALTERIRKAAIYSDSIYFMAMRLIDTETPPALVEQITKEACRLAGVPYPPELMT